MLFGDSINAGEEYGEAAVDQYADWLTDPKASLWQKVGAGIGGAFAQLWTSCTSDATLTTLLTAETASRYLYRPMWQYYPPENPEYASRYATRGWGWNAPYDVGEEAVQKLSLPPYNPATAVRQVEMNPWEFYKGPSIVEPANSQLGGGIEYVAKAPFVPAE